MNPFIFRGPLPPGSSLFRGRRAELTQLQRACQGEVQSYITIYGGRQTGKTSLLLKLETSVPEHVRACRIDFQSLPNGTTAQAFNLIAHRVAAALRLETPSQITEAPELIAFLCRAIEQASITRLMLLIEEIGTLCETARHDIANVTRSAFTNRFDYAWRSLASLVVVISGSIELYDLAATEVSTLHNICESIYLSDLSKQDAISLISDGLSSQGVQRTEAEIFGQEVYGQVGGHPYLVQRLGGMLEEDLSNGFSISVERINVAVENLLSDDVLLNHLYQAVREQNLLPAVKTLLDGSARFSRLDEDMARFELLGLAHKTDACWVVRNPLFAKALQQWTVGAQSSQPSLTTAKSETTTNTSGGVTLGAQGDAAVDGDVVGRDKIISIRAESGSTLILGNDALEKNSVRPQPTPTSTSSATTASVDVAILTVLPEEYNAVCGQVEALWPVVEGPANIYAWQIGEVQCTRSTGSYTVSVGMMGRAGTPLSALATLDAIQRWKPRYVFFVGIAGGLSGMAKGDVIIADIIHGYEYGKIEKQFMPRDNWTYRTDLGLLNSATACASRLEWRPRFQEPPPTPTVPKIVTGEIASGDKVIDDPSNTFFEQVLKTWPKIKAVEMEGAGVGAAIEQAQALGIPVGFMMVRGISDVPRAPQSGEEQGTTERDNWKPYASTAAAAFTIDWIGHGLPERPR